MNKYSISGRNIYVDKKKRTIYHDFFSKKGFIIKQDAVATFYLYQNRFLLLLLGVILLIDYVSTPVTITLSIGLLAVAEVLFRYFFFSKLPVSPITSKMERKTIIKTIILSKEKDKTIIKAFLYFIFCISILLNAYLQETNSILYISSVILALFSLYYSIVHIVGSIKM